jgi:predicted DNA-binding transcriptional regulator AlpA
MAKLLDERALASQLQVSLSTLRKWRITGKGPQFVKMAGAVRYRETDITSWIESRLTGGSTPTAPTSAEAQPVA